ncbi:hypothetical protein [Metabacillus sp. Hm71]|uniref:hypothetical protein n=1 Tax=Metabacillus sp. Hm71 TaxID=3450743 RepID=UPI003F4244D8
MLILKHTILDLVKEKEVLTLSELATRLQTSEEYIRVTIEQMMDNGTHIKLTDDIVHIPTKFEWLPYAVGAFLIGMIVFLPALLDLN